MMRAPKMLDHTKCTTGRHSHCIGDPLVPMPWVQVRGTSHCGIDEDKRVVAWVRCSLAACVIDSPLHHVGIARTDTSVLNSCKCRDCPYIRLGFCEICTPTAISASPYGLTGGKVFSENTMQGKAMKGRK